MSALKIVCGNTVGDKIIELVWVRQALGIRHGSAVGISD